MSNKPVGSFKQVMGVPDDGVPWAWFKCDLLKSAAWRARSIHCIRLLDFLIIEHLAHASTENGHLKASYSQFVAFGIGRRFIPDAIAEAEALRLIKVERGGKCAHARDHMNVYTLTFFGVKSRGNHQVYYVQPSNDWRKVTAEDVRRIRAEVIRPARAKRNATRANPFRKNSFSDAPVVNCPGAPVVDLDKCTRGELSHGKPRLSAVHHG
jgi:hypothetical protein